MNEKKLITPKSPDLKQMQEVVIDLRTRIYIPAGEDPRKAKIRYLDRFNTMKKF